MIPLDEAQQFVFGLCTPLAGRPMVLDDAVGCVAAGPVVATEPVPPFTNSSMDGFAVRAQDTRGAPVRLDVIGSVMAGHLLDGAVGPGQAARIMTGAPLPAGADAVCMIEQTEAEPGGAGVTILRALERGDFVRQPGRDVAIGDVIVPAGCVLTPAHVGVLASQGLTRVVVHPRPTVGVLSTGDELSTDPGPLPPGKIRDANRHTLLALARREGWACVDLGLVGDDESALVDVLSRGGATCDAVVTSGGVSVGDLDLVRTVLEKLSSGSMRWMQVAIKPAKPFAFGLLAGSGTPVFALPGNPVSAMVSFELFVRPSLRLLGGHRSPLRPVVRAVSEEALPRQRDGKLHLLRARVTVDPEGRWRVRAGRGQESHQLHAMAEANALLLLPDGEGAPAGAAVDVLLLEADRLGAP
ncbi:MAG: gephyrin-like molybdotransferase Glp [Acidimicrobiales bacterium]